MAEDPRFLLHFKTLDKFKEKLADGTVSEQRHLVFIKDAQLVWCRGKYYADGYKSDNFTSYYNSWKISKSTTDTVEITLEGNQWNANTRTWVALSKALNIPVSDDTHAGIITGAEHVLLNTTLPDRCTTIENNLSAEITRAKAAEKANADAISAEATARANAISGLDADKSDSSDHVTVRVVETDGKISSVVVTESDIASATTLSAVKSKLDGIESGANNYSHPTYTSYTSGLYKITTNNLGHVTAATTVSKSDITGLGIPGSDTNTTYSFATGDGNGQIKITDSNGNSTNVSVKGLASGAYANAYSLPIAKSDTLGGIKVGTNLSINTSTGVLSATDTKYTAGTGITINGDNVISCTVDAGDSLPEILKTLAEHLSYGNGTFYLNGDWYPDNLQCNDIYTTGNVDTNGNISAKGNITAPHFYKGNP